MQKAIISVFIICLIILGACSMPLDEVPTPEAELIEPSLALATDTPQPSATNTPLPTATYTATLTNTATSTPTPYLGFLDAELYRAWNTENQTFYYFTIGDAEQTFYGTVDGNPITCEPDTQYPGNLVCVADKFLFGEPYSYFEFFTDASRTQLLYSGEYFTGLAILQSATPTSIYAGLIWPRAEFTAADITWAGGETWCPLRGVNITCETEYRNYSGVCVVGSSCFDMCGFFYAVDTIKDRTGEWEGCGPCIP